MVVLAMVLGPNGGGDDDNDDDAQLLPKTV